jgi:3-hydroxyethyl bacteriochlorophyllide a dehydrogenase
VPGARCFGPVRGLFGGAAARLVTAGARTTPVPEALGADAILLALAATALHARMPMLAAERARGGALIVGHGVLGRLLARLALADGGAPPTVWETNPARHTGATGYAVIAPDDDPRRDYTTIFDASGDAGLLDTLIGRLAPGGEIVLAGFYEAQIAFAFPPAFMREARLRIAAEWKPADMQALTTLIAEGRLSLGGLLTHSSPIADAGNAYRMAFEDPACLKMSLDWRTAA